MTQTGFKKPHKSFGFMDFIWRWGAAILLVFATYNPSGHSFVHWFFESLGEQNLGAAHFLVGAILVAGWAAFLVATGNSLGSLGTVIGAALIGGSIWLLVDLGVVRANSASSMTWLALFALATLLAIGMSWSHIWRRLSGQLEVDDN
jgi:hypothetical protein